MRLIYHYLVQLKAGRAVLWCYLMWYLVTLYHHFDPSPRIWINSLGISVVIGVALMLSVTGSGRGNYWQTFRLFWMPFAVSSFSALIKNKGFFVILSPDIGELLSALGWCGIFLLLVAVVKWSHTKKELLQGA